MSLASLQSKDEEKREKTEKWLRRAFEIEVAIPNYFLLCLDSTQFISPKAEFKLEKNIHNFDKTVFFSISGFYQAGRFVKRVK